MGEQRDAHGQLLPLLLVGAPAPWPAPQQGVQQWVPTQEAPASITGPSISLLLFPEPRVGEALSLGQAGRDVLGRGFPGRDGACRVSGSSSNPLRHRYENRSPVVECKHYLQDRGISVGCRLNQSEIIQFQPFHVLINASLGGRTLEIPSERMQLQDLGTAWWWAPTLLCGAVGTQGCPIMFWLVVGPPEHGDGAHWASPVPCSETGGARQPDHPQHEQQPAAADLDLPVPQSPVPGARCQVQEQQGHQLDGESPPDAVPSRLCSGTSRAPASMAVPVLIAWPTSLCRSTR